MDPQIIAQAGTAIAGMDSNTIIKAASLIGSGIAVVGIFPVSELVWLAHVHLKAWHANQKWQESCWLTPSSLPL